MRKIIIPTVLGLVSWLAGVAIVSAAGLTEPAAGQTTAPNERIGAAVSGGLIRLVLDSPLAQVNDTEQTMDVPPQEVDGQPMVPLRLLAESLGARLSYDSESRTVTYAQGNNVLVLRIGSTSYRVNGQPKTLETAPVIVDGRTLVPLGFVRTGLAADAILDASDRSVTILLAPPTEGDAGTDTAIDEQDMDGLARSDYYDSRRCPRGRCSAPKPPTADQIKQSTISQGFRAAFGRAPAEGELKQWLAIPNGDSRVANATAVANSLRRVLKENQAEREAMLHLVATALLGRKLGPAALQTWSAEVVRSGQTFEEAYLRSTGRTSMIFKSYEVAFGRSPSRDEEDYWLSVPTGDARVKNLDTLVGNHRTWLKTPEAAQERQDMVQRVYQRVYRRAPRTTELRVAAAYVRREAPAYDQLAMRLNRIWRGDFKSPTAVITAIADLSLTEDEYLAALRDGKVPYTVQWPVAAMSGWRLRGYRVSAVGGAGTMPDWVRQYLANAGYSPDNLPDFILSDLNRGLLPKWDPTGLPLNSDGTTKRDLLGYCRRDTGGMVMSRPAICIEDQAAMIEAAVQRRLSPEEFARALNERVIAIDVVKNMLNNTSPLTHEYLANVTPLMAPDLLTQVTPFAGPSALTQVTPLLPKEYFTMPIGNNFTMPIGNNLTVLEP